MIDERHHDDVAAWRRIARLQPLRDARIRHCSPGGGAGAFVSASVFHLRANPGRMQ